MYYITVQANYPEPLHIIKLVRLTVFMSRTDYNTLIFQIQPNSIHCEGNGHSLQIKGISVNAELSPIKLYLQGVH